MINIKRGVSLYSLQDEYARKRMTLEDIFRALKDMGVEGVELISDQMIHGAPHPAPDTVAMWRGLMDKYGFDYVSNDIFINSTLYRNRKLTLKEQLALLEAELANARALGFGLVRLVSNTDARLIEPALAAAEKHDVTMALEIHAGMSLESPDTKAYLDQMLRLGSPYVGIVVDCGIFSQRMPRVSRRYFEGLGLSKDVADYIDSIFERGSDPYRFFTMGDIRGGASFPEELTAMFRSPIDIEYAHMSSGYENTPFSALDPYLAYVKSIHGKCYEMTEDCEEYSIDYPGFIRYLKEKKWSGYICTEYEGNRFVLIDRQVDSLEQVRRHQEMLKRHLGR